MSNFAIKLKELRTERGLSQVELAKKIGLRQSNITSWERRNNEPLPDALIKLSQFFKVSTDYLLGIENEEGYIVMSNELSEDENNLIDMVRQLNMKEKNTIYELVELMVKAKSK